MQELHAMSGEDYITTVGTAIGIEERYFEQMTAAIASGIAKALKGV